VPYGQLSGVWSTPRGGPAAPPRSRWPARFRGGTGQLIGLPIVAAFRPRLSIG